MSDAAPPLPEEPAPTAVLPTASVEEYSEPALQNELTEEEADMLLSAVDEGRLKCKSGDGRTLFLSLPAVRKGETSVAGAAEVALRRAREEASLQCEVHELEEAKAILQQQIDTLSEPVAAEARAVRALQRRVNDEDANLQRLKSANMDAKELRLAEAKLLENRVAELKAVVSQEQAERGQQEERLNRFNDENAQLRREIEEEKRKIEWQKQELKRAETAHEDVVVEQRRLVKKAKNTEELTEEVNARCADLTEEHKTLKSACLEMTAELVRLKGEISSVQTTLQSRGDHSELRKVYEEKLAIWNALEKPAKFKEDIDFMSRENRNLASNLEKADAEYSQLAATLNMLQQALRRAQGAKKLMAEENKELVSAMATLNHDSIALQSQEAMWEDEDDYEEEDECSDDAYNQIYSRRPNETQASLGEEEGKEEDLKATENSATQHPSSDRDENAHIPRSERAIESFFQRASRPNPQYVQELREALDTK